MEKGNIVDTEMEERLDLRLHEGREPGVLEIISHGRSMALHPCQGGVYVWLATCTKMIKI